MRVGLFSKDMGMDLGTANSLVYVKGKGIVIREPSVVAIQKDSGHILAVGEEAKRMIGRTPGNIVAIRPMRDGVIADFDVTQSMIKHFINKSSGARFFGSPQGCYRCAVRCYRCRGKGRAGGCASGRSQGGLPD